VALWRGYIKGRHHGQWIETARLGDERSGLLAEVTTEAFGVTVHARLVDGAPRLDVYLNGGRGHAQDRVLLGVVARHGMAFTFHPATKED
jgi:hypothetical protein